MTTAEYQEEHSERPQVGLVEAKYLEKEGCAQTLGIRLLALQTKLRRAE